MIIQCLFIVKAMCKNVQTHADNFKKHVKEERLLKNQQAHTSPNR